MAEGKQTRGPGLVVRLTPDERDQWHAAARAAGFAQTARWVRQVVSDHVAGAGSRPARSAADPAVLAQLGKIGSNLNQLAHRVNVAALQGGAFPVEAAELERLRVEVSRLRAAVRGEADS